MRLHFAHCFPFHPIKPCSSAGSPSIIGISTTRATFAGIGGSRLAIALSDIVGVVGVCPLRQSVKKSDLGRKLSEETTAVQA